jgi:hypothetical protein
MIEDCFLVTRLPRRLAARDENSKKLERFITQNSPLFDAPLPGLDHELDPVLTLSSLLRDHAELVDEVPSRLRSPGFTIIGSDRRRRAQQLTTENISHGRLRQRRDAPNYADGKPFGSGLELNTLLRRFSIRVHWSGSKISDRRSQIGGRGSKISDRKSKIADRGSKISDRRSQITSSLHSSRTRR